MENNIQRSDVRDQEPDTARKENELRVHLKWLKPVADLPSIQGGSFGRGISQSLKGLKAPVKLSIRNKESAVVMPLKKYEEIRAIMETCPDLVDSSKQSDLVRDTDFLDELYLSITASRSGADALFTASEEDINNSYKPGETESP